MEKRILFIRTFKPAAIENPIPPLGLLYISSNIINSFGKEYDIAILDTGLDDPKMERIKEEIRRVNPFLVGLSTLTCEADFMHEVARAVKEIDKNITVLAGGPHATVAYQYLLQDKNIDYAIIGEGEKTVVEFLKALELGCDFAKIDGIAYISDSRLVCTRPRTYVENLDLIPFPAWGLIDLKAYAKYPNWNGVLKQKCAMPIITSRGCPFNCIFCHNIFGKEFRARSAENVFSEISLLYQNYNVKEFHVVDDVFNLDAERVKNICSLIIDSGIKINLAFPNGLRVDIMSKELLERLKKAGTYKINYAIETASPRLQRMINKNLNIDHAQRIIKLTVEQGIITAGYFMLGFPTEAVEEMRKTIDLAVSSELDIAYFFKVTPYPETILYNSVYGSQSSLWGEKHTFNELHFYSVKQSCAAIPAEQLNSLVLEGQYRFYFSFKRIIRLMSKSLIKLRFFRNMLHLMGLFLQSYLIGKLTERARKLP